MPGKALYLAMESDPSIEFDHQLGEKLGKTLEEIRALPNAEYQSWYMYYRRKNQRAELQHLVAQNMAHVRR